MEKFQSVVNRNRRFSERREGECPGRTCWRGGVAKCLKRRIPILTWLPNYTKGDAVSDFIAGITVGLTVVPQSMAYASIAGLSPEYGLYSSYLGCFLYVIFGSCRQVALGLTAIMGLLTYDTCGNNFPQCAILVGFYSGLFELLMACLQLGFLVSFISESVTLAFTSAASITIIFAQLSNFMGLSGKRGNGFVGICFALIENIHTIQIGDTIMGLASFATLLLLKTLSNVKPQANTKVGKIGGNVFWLTSVSRNIIVVVITSLIAYLWSDPPPFKLNGNVQGGLPDIWKWPSLQLPQERPADHHENVFYQNQNSSSSFSSLHNSNSSVLDNHFEDSIQMQLSIVESFQSIASGALTIAVISIIQNIAISKYFGNANASQEMIALGLANTLGIFFSAIPISGSFSRSAVNEASGVRSPAGGFYTGALVLLSLTFFTRTFKFIPKASLAAVIISAVMFMIDLPVWKIWKISRMDFTACIITFCTALLFGMEWGIVIGVAISLISLISKSLRPSLTYEVENDPRLGIQYLYARVGSSLLFPSVDRLRDDIQKMMDRHDDESITMIVFNLEKWTSWDYTSTRAFVDLEKGLRKAGKVSLIVNANAELISALQVAGLKKANLCSETHLVHSLKKLMPNYGSTLVTLPLITQ